MEWISIELDIPKYSKRTTAVSEDLLVFTKNKSKVTGIYDFELKRWWVHNSPHEEVTHWTLLPEDPVTCSYCKRNINKPDTPVVMIDKDNPTGEIMHRECFIEYGGEFVSDLDDED